MTRTRKNRPRACRTRKKRKRATARAKQPPTQHSVENPKPSTEIPNSVENSKKNSKKNNSKEKPRTNRAYRARRYTVEAADLSVIHGEAYDSAYRRHLHRVFMQKRIPGKSIRHIEINPDLYHNYFSTEVFFEYTRMTYNGTVETIRYGGENVYTV